MRGKFSPPPPGVGGGGYSGFQVTVLILAAILSSPSLEIGSNFLSPPPSPWEFKTLFYCLVAGPYLYATASTLKHSYPKFTKDQQQNIE